MSATPPVPATAGGRRPARAPARLLAVAMGRRPVVSLLALLALLYVPWLGAIPLDSTLEGNRVQAAREMLMGGDWIVPRLNGEPYLAKPPLHPWSMALAAAPFGDVCLWSARLVSVVGALATCLLVWLWGRRELGRRAGLLGALATGTAVVLAEKAVRAELELVLTATTTLAVLALHEALRDGPRRRAAIVVSGLALGAAALVKGPPPLIVYVAVVVTLAALGVERRAALRAGATALGLALLCALAWVVPLITRMGLDRMLGVFHDQFVQRLSRTGPTNDEPFWFYGPAILVGMLPAALAAPVVAGVWPARAGTSLRARRASILLWGWALLPLVLFSFSAGKESRYLLPTVPAWGLLLGWGWTRARARGEWARWRGGLLRAAATAGWLLPLVLTVVGAQRFPDHRTAVVAAGLVALAARAVFAWAPARPDWRLAALAAGVLAGKVAWAETLLVHQREGSPVSELAARVDAEVGPGEAWILVGPYRSWLHFQVESPFVSAPAWEAVEGARAAGDRPANVLVAPDRLWPAEAGARAGWREVERWELDGDGYLLAVRD